MSGVGIIKQGWLTKEGGKVKSWKKRWFVLTAPSTLTYHAKKGGEKKGNISLKDCGPIQESTYKDKKNCFVIVTPKRTYYFMAESSDAVKSWLEVLNAAREGNASPAKALQGRKPGLVTRPKAATGIGLKDAGESKVGIDDFEPLAVIGRGSFGKVLQVRYKVTGEIYAMKQLNKKSIIQRGEIQNTVTEKNILMQLNHPFLVQLYYSFQTATKLYFVMDYINGGELFFHLQKEGIFSPERVKFYTAEIVLGIEYLHEKGIIYRDLKPENLLLSAEGHICMTDFGISKEGLHCKDDRTSTFCGTPEYLAPEVLEGKRYGKEVDWWSLGTLMFEMLTSLPPFYAEDVQFMYSKIMKEKLDLEKKFKDPDVTSIIGGFLERDPAKRLSNPTEIKKHPYFAGIDWERLRNKEIMPSYIPPVSDPSDIHLIDPMFTEEKLSVDDPSAFGEVAPQDFPNFTFVADSNIRKK